MILLCVVVVFWVVTYVRALYFTHFVGYGASQCETKSNTINLIVRLNMYLMVIFGYYFTYNE